MFRCHSLPRYLFLVTVILATSWRGASLCRHDQSAALLRLKASFRFDNSYSTLPSWKADNTNCCTWEGVTCNDTSGYVTALDLCFYGISGNLSSSDIFELTSLRFLSLAYNYFDASPWPSPGFLSLAYNYFDASPWPSPGFEQLKHLKYLDLSFSGLSGDLPIENGQLSNIVTLKLSGTKINGPIPVPERFVKFSSLEVLSLRGCGMTGTFPPWIFHIKSLISLDTSGNDNLCGELPEFIEGSSLQELSISGTKFSGKIPESMGNLRNLTMLDLSNFQFKGSIQPFAQWPMIQQVYLSDNNLTGSLPSDGYLALHKLTTVELNNNLISGVIPASLFSQPSLEFLDLSQNNFTGNFLLYSNISSNNLASIDLSNNKLQGPVPKLLSELVGIYWLDLSSNSFTGTVDLGFIKNYKELDHLSLSYNKLSAVDEGSNYSYLEYPNIWELELASCNVSYMPKFLMHQSRISVLDLSSNNIGGHIPDWIWGIGWYFSVNLSHNLFASVGTKLSNTPVFDLDLSSNEIEGALPLPPLRAYRLDYSNNHFNSSIMPEFWSSISSAISLSLANNSLTGKVSDLICNATNLEVLDLSFNSFIVLIPPCLFKRNNHLQILSLRRNNFHGSLPQYIGEECALQIIDLNGNKLEGEMPVSLVNCHMLQVLDLGNNLISDDYPEWLGVLPLLKVLILASNRFRGSIDYYGMNKLQVLDLSSNSLNGSIPARFLKQFKAMMISSGASNMYVGIIAPSSSVPASTSVSAQHRRGHSAKQGRRAPETWALSCTPSLAPPC